MRKALSIVLFGVSLVIFFFACLEVANEKWGTEKIITFTVLSDSVNGKIETSHGIFEVGNGKLVKGHRYQVTYASAFSHLYPVVKNYNIQD